VLSKAANARRKRRAKAVQQTKQSAKVVHTCYVRNCKWCKGAHELGRCPENPWD
jgi:hypothetical protein